MTRATGYDISIRFVAPTFDRARLEQVVRHQFGAEDVSVSIEPYRHAPASGARPLPRWEPTPGTGAAELLALVRARGIARWRELKDVPNARSALELLLMDGHIEKVRHGVYKAGGVDVGGDVKVGRSHALGPRQRQILEVLAKPHSATELREMAGVSRQAIDQLVKKLMGEGLVRRLPSPMEASDWLYVRADQRDIDALAARQPALSPLEQRLLCLVPASGGARASDLAKHVGPGIHAALQRLMVKGLIEEVGTPRRRIVRLTRKGLAHPLYVHDAEHVTLVEETAAFQPQMIRLMLALDALGEARAMDITDVSGVKPKGRIGTGQYLQRLRAGGYIEQTKLDHKAPLYRMTKKGVAAISSAKAKGRQVSAIVAKRKLTEAREARSRAFSRAQAASSISAMRNSRTPEVLEIVACSTEMRASEIGGRLSRPYADRRSIYISLNELERRGCLAKRKADDGQIFWSITEGGTHLLEQLTTEPMAVPSTSMRPARVGT